MSEIRSDGTAVPWDGTERPWDVEMLAVFAEAGRRRQIRHTHPGGFRSGEWATIRCVVPARGRDCYLVEFSDSVTDLWAVSDPGEPYEFRAVVAGKDGTG
jgi:hypothetical protein